MTRRIFKWIGLLVLLLVVCAILFAVFLPEAWIRGVAGEKGSARLGRDFSINGPLNVDWDWTTPQIHAEDIRLANAPGMDTVNMLRIERLDFSIKIWQLLFGRVNLPDLTITGAELNLQKKDAETKNWDLPAFSKGRAVGAVAVPEDRHDFPAIGHLELKNSMLSYKDDIKKLDLMLKLDTASGSSGNERNIIVSGDGTMQGQAFTLKAAGGSVDLLRDTKKPYPLDLSLAMGSTSIAVKGTFLDPVKMTGIDATLDLKGDNLADLFYLTAIPLPPSPPYTIAGALKKDEDIWHFNGFQGKVGDSDLAGSLEYDTSGERGKMVAKLQSNYLDMDDLSGFIGAAPSVKPGEAAGEEQRKQAETQAARTRLLPDVPINLDRLRAADMDVTMVANRLHAPGYPLDNLTAHVTLEDGLLKIDPLKLGVASGGLEGKLTLNGRESVPEVSTDIVLKRLSLKDFFKDSRFESMSAGHFGGHIGIEGRGKSLAEVMAGSNGDITLVISGGQISLLIVEAAGIDIAEATPLFLGEDKATGIRCGVGDFGVKDGLLTSRIFVFDTTDTNLQGEARIDMKNETINARLEAHPKDQSPLEIKTPILISGRLKSPSIGIDPKEAGARAGVAAVLGTVLTPLASIIPFIELGTGEDSDCAGLIEQARRHADAGPSQ